MAHIDCTLFAQSLDRNVRAAVYIPTTSAEDYLSNADTDYFAPEKRFPVLYLLHGHYGDCTEWVRCTGIERYAQERQIAVVMPSVENSMCLNLGEGESYLTYLTEELLDFMEKMFPLSRKREERFIAGRAMGGYGAIRCALERPELYGYCVSLSGLLDQACLENTPYIKLPKSYERLLDLDGRRDADLLKLLETRVREGRKLPKFYLACGTEDGVRSANEAFYQHASEMGAVIEYEACSGTHGWDFWDQRIRDVINRIL